ncbi:MAG: hypothetical protein A3F14_02820 [Gammaproteobacteria bacterium RIFCSPHIGHO2_12_FULL_43_28]|nr:MAG: hypothetical protein A3F14_02820 [Gammaproteobacteria bacterium RIFCSPHIGHO2_12_FULL_43_28]
MSKEDKLIENLLELDGIRYVIDEHLGLWVKFEVKRVSSSKDRPHGIRYSLSLHDRSNNRIMGFDNAHAIEYGGKKHVAPKRTHDHWHSDESDKGRPYAYIDAGRLIEDFWKEVEIKTKQLEGSNK